MSNKPFTNDEIANIFGKISLPSEDEINQRCIERYKNSLNNPNQFTYWFPVVKKVLDSNSLQVKYPKTKTTPLSQDAFDVLLKEDEQAIINHAEINELVKWVQDSMKEFDSEHAFIKNSLFSAKHSWIDSCYITKSSDIKKNICNILYYWAMVSHEYPTSMVVREFINATPAFHAFNKMPITQEFRLFSKDGVTHSYQPYWPAHSIQNPDCDNWEQKLKSISKPSEELLALMIQAANEITKEIGGDWSVDFLIDENGIPWLIDMALTSQSYISDDLVKLEKNN